MSDKQLKLFIFAGEKSGDLHGSYLLRALLKAKPDLKVTAVAGPLMRETLQSEKGVVDPLQMEDFEVMGFTDVLLSLPKLMRHFKTVLKHILTTSPSAVVLIDYPGFNLRLAKALRKKDYKGKIIQYVSPTVWAHGKSRAQSMEKTLDLLLTIYPFEKECFVGRDLDVEYIGNPLCEYLLRHPYEKEWQHILGIPTDKELIALFPGSRASEIKRNLPLILNAAEKILKTSPDATFGLSISSENAFKQVCAEANKCSAELRHVLYYIPKKYTYELMQKSRSAIAKSGTVTLELALHLCPTVVIYPLTALNRLIAKHILKLKLPYYCIVNILSKDFVFPELIEQAPSVERLVSAFLPLHAEGKTRKTCKTGCETLLNNFMQYKDSSTRAAEAILKKIC